MEAIQQINPTQIYQRFVNKYQNAPILFAQEVVGMSPTIQQDELLESIAYPSARVSLRAGRGCGKTSALAIVVLWWMLTHPFAKVLCTASNVTTLRNVLFSELRYWFDKLVSRIPLFGNLFELTKTTFFHKQHDQTWMTWAKTAPINKAENLLGAHAEHLLVIFEEASGIHDDVFTSVLNSLTGGPGNRAIMVGNPTKTNGFFYDSQTTKKDNFTTLHWNSEESPLVSKEFLDSALEEYDGKSSYGYKVHVLGEFCHDSGLYLIDQKDVEEAVNRRLSLSKPQYVISADVAGTAPRGRGSVRGGAAWAAHNARNIASPRIAAREL